MSIPLTSGSDFPCHKACLIMFFSSVIISAVRSAVALISRLFVPEAHFVQPESAALYYESCYFQRDDQLHSWRFPTRPGIIYFVQPFSYASFPLSGLAFLIVRRRQQCLSMPGSQEENFFLF